MDKNIGIWIDHKRAVIVSASVAGLTTKTLQSKVDAHHRFSGALEGGGEKKYEQRRGEQLDRYYDNVLGQLGRPQAVLILGPGEAKLELERRLRRSAVFSDSVVTGETTDTITDPQIVAKVKEHFGL